MKNFPLEGVVVLRNPFPDHAKVNSSKLELTLVLQTDDETMKKKVTSRVESPLW